MVSSNCGVWHAAWSVTMHGGYTALRMITPEGSTDEYISENNAWVVQRVRNQCCFHRPFTAMTQPKSALLIADRRWRTSSGRSSSSASGASRFLLPLGALSCMACRSCHACLQSLAIARYLEQIQCFSFLESLKADSDCQPVPSGHLASSFVLSPCQ